MNIVDTVLKQLLDGARDHDPTSVLIIGNICIVAGILLLMVSRMLMGILVTLAIALHGFVVSLCFWWGAYDLFFRWNYFGLPLMILTLIIIQLEGYIFCTSPERKAFFAYVTGTTCDPSPPVHAGASNGNGGTSVGVSDGSFEGGDRASAAGLESHQPASYPSVAEPAAPTRRRSLRKRNDYRVRFSWDEVLE